YWRELERSQWWDPARLEQLRVERLRALLRHAARTCLWYAAEWQARGLNAEDLRGTAELGAWPVIARATLRQHREAMCSTDPSVDLIRKATGGSSGVPLQFALDRAGNQRRMAAWHRGYGWAGAAPGTR